MATSPVGRASPPADAVARCSPGSTRKGLLCTAWGVVLADRRRRRDLAIKGAWHGSAAVCFHELQQWGYVTLVRRRFSLLTRAEHVPPLCLGLDRREDFMFMGSYDRSGTEYAPVSGSQYFRDGNTVGGCPPRAGYLFVYEVASHRCHDVTLGLAHRRRPRPAVPFRIRCSLSQTCSIGG